MDPSNPLSSESKAKSLLRGLKRRTVKEPDMKFLSIEETSKLMNDEENKPKRSKGTKTPMPMVDEHLAKEWERGKKDIREIFSVLPSAERMQKRNQKAKGPQITPMMVEFFQSYLNENTHIKKIAVLGFNTGYTSETFLMARNDIEVVAFDPLRNPYVSPQAQFISETYSKRFMLIGGAMSESIMLLGSFLGQKRFDMVYIDSGSYPRSAKEDLESSIYLAHSRTVIFMENVRPYSNTGADVFNAWDSLVTQGKLRETSGPRTWEELNRCVCEGMFVASEQIVPLREGERSKVRTFWETEPECILWKYGNELKDASPAQAMVIWEEMIRKNINPDRTAINMYVAALGKSTDPRHKMEEERAKTLLKNM